MLRNPSTDVLVLLKTREASRSNTSGNCNPNSLYREMLALIASLSVFHVPPHQNSRRGGWPAFPVWRGRVTTVTLSERKNSADLLNSAGILAREKQHNKYARVSSYCIFFVCIVDKVCAVPFGPWLSLLLFTHFCNFLYVMIVFSSDTFKCAMEWQTLSSGRD